MSETRASGVAATQGRPLHVEGPPVFCLTRGMILASTVAQAQEV